MSAQVGSVRPADVRPMLPADLSACQRASHETFAEAGGRYGWSQPELDEATQVRGERRLAHAQRTDPDGCWLAAAPGEGSGAQVVGVAVALRRGPLWHLSLLIVAPGWQGQGLGARLLGAALGTATGAAAGTILSSSDPKALRRYGRAGFALYPGYHARGPVDRALLPATPGVREGSWDADGERVDDLVTRLRGAPYGPDLAFWADQGSRLLVADDGYAVLRDSGVASLGARDPRVAQALLWAALAECEGEVEVTPLTGGQQWAVAVALAARLALSPGESVCTRGAVGPLAPYLPSGAFG